MMTGSMLSCGPTAVLELPAPDGSAASSTVVVCSYRQQILDPCILRGQGQEPTDYDFVVLKSAVHFRSNFTELAGAIVEVTGPGIHSSRMSDFVYEKVARPLLIWPLDQVVIVAHRTCLGQGASLHEMHSSPSTAMFLDCNSHSFRHVSCCWLGFSQSIHESN